LLRVPSALGHPAASTSAPTAAGRPLNSTEYPYHAYVVGKWPPSDKVLEDIDQHLSLEVATPPIRVEVLECVEGRPDILYGQLQDGSRGYFPASCIVPPRRGPNLADFESVRHVPPDMRDFGAPSTGVGAIVPAQDYQPARGGVHPGLLRG